MRGLIDGERHGVALRGRDVHELLVAFGAGIGELGRWIQRGSHESDRVMQQLDPTIPRGRVTGARHRAVWGGVVGDVAVESLRQPLNRGAGELELRFADLPNPRPAVRQIDGARVFLHLPHRQLVVRHPVLAGVRRRTAARELERGQRLDPLGASQCGGGIVHDGLLGGTGRA